MPLAVADSQPRFGGIPLDASGMSRSIECLLEWMESDTCHQVATVNLDFIVRAQHDPWLRAILNRTSMNLIDGTPLVWVLRALGYQVPERVAGSDLVPRLLSRLANTGHGVYLLGGSPAVAALAARHIRSEFPGVRLCGVDSPEKRPIETLDPEVVTRIRQAAPRLLLVAFGNPKQEYWMDLHLAEVEVPVAIGIGGTVDFLAGQRRRAPRWMQRSGLEWVMRMIQEPARLAPRYAVDAMVFASLLSRELARGGTIG